MNTQNKIITVTLFILLATTSFASGFGEYAGILNYNFSTITPQSQIWTLWNNYSQPVNFNTSIPITSNFIISLNKTTGTINANSIQSIKVTVNPISSFNGIANVVAYLQATAISPSSSNTATINIATIKELDINANIPSATTTSSSTTSTTTIQNGGSGIQGSTGLGSSTTTILQSANAIPSNNTTTTTTIIPTTIPTTTVNSITTTASTSSSSTSITTVNPLTANVATTNTPTTSNTPTPSAPSNGQDLIILIIAIVLIIIVLFFGLKKRKPTPSTSSRPDTTVVKL